MRISYSVILTTLLGLASSQAYTLQKTSSTAVIFQTDGKPVSENQDFYIVDQSNKAKVLVRVEKFNSKQAKAKVIKGNITSVQVGMSLRPVRTPASVQGADGQMATAITTKSKSRNTWGLMASYMMSSMNAKFSYGGANQTAAMTGSSVGLLGFYDYTLNKNLQVRGMGGLETFDAKQAKETNVCDKGASAECNVKINYLSLYAMGKYNLTKTKNKFWIGGGLGYLLAVGKSSSVLDTSLITSNQVLTLGLGLDIGSGTKNVIPVSLDYSLFPSSATVSASIISLKVGFGFGQ
ncbi:MAG: hypothetical protein B7Y39_14625 [Bdellovibrio sp. 28-41-41]|nr:MAG: hypothetical protein B7Y39_14625 [Bdellovibrio sp. 28-41-41]